MLDHYRGDRGDLDQLMAHGYGILSLQQGAAAVAWAIAGGRFGGVAATAADPLPQAGQFGGQGGELSAQLLVILSQSY
jgi:hypothetical protein